MGPMRRAAALATVVVGLAMGGCGGEAESMASEGNGRAGRAVPAATKSDPVGGAPSEAPVADDAPARPPVGVRRGVVGTVRNAAGQPVEMVLVQPRALDPNAAAVPEIAVYSGKDGRYSWDLPPGRWELTAVADGYRTTRKSVTVGTTGPATLDFVLERVR